MRDNLKRRFVFFSDLLLSSGIKTNVQQAIPFWMASLLVGFVAVGYTKIFCYAEGLLAQLLSWHEWMIFVVAPTSFLFAWLIIMVIAPNAKGSGIPQVMAA